MLGVLPGLPQRLLLSEGGVDGIREGGAEGACAHHYHHLSHCDTQRKSLRASLNVYFSY